MGRIIRAVLSCVLFTGTFFASPGVCLAAPSAASEPVVSEIVAFPSGNPELTLTGTLYRSVTIEAAARAPAKAGVVLAHGCAGIRPQHRTVSNKLVGLGYVALVVDSFSPRGESSVCGKPRRVSPRERVADAYGARTFLAAMPGVDGRRIALIGWSHGGLTALLAVNERTADELAGALRAEPFAAVVAYYPWCLQSIDKLNSPLLVLIGAEDDWTPAARCESMTVPAAAAFPYELHVYPGAAHAFDANFSLRKFSGHSVGRHPEAAVASERVLKRFLAQHIDITE